ncbi:hypothetical protein [Kitasatospora purpeofusca]|uniref:hypothetical protein n=1 Tax=Kitasatospora purpeofusca TaxID=67352 RepID=UPI0004BF3223|nr:hypothetical protein [Kitasatospora purpeofusca]
MDGPGLSSRERCILAEIEGDLRADRGLDRRLRTMRCVLPIRVLDSVARVPATVLVVMASLSLGLLMVGASVHTAAALAPFAAIWLPSVLLLLVRLVRRRPRRPRRPRRAGRPGRPERPDRVDGG